MDSACAQTQLSGHFADADAFGELLARLGQLFRLGARPPELRADDALLGNELAVPGELGFDDAEPGVQALHDNAALEFGECASDLEQQLALRRGGVEVLLIEVEVDAGGLKVLLPKEQIEEAETRDLTTATSSRSPPTR